VKVTKSEGPVTRGAYVERGSLFNSSKDGFDDVYDYASCASLV